MDDDAPGHARQANSERSRSRTPALVAHRHVGIRDHDGRPASMRQRDEPRHGLADAGDVSVLNASPERLAASGVHLQPGETLERAPGAPFRRATLKTIVPAAPLEPMTRPVSWRARHRSADCSLPNAPGAATPVASSRMENVRRARAFIAAAVYGFSGEA